MVRILFRSPRLLHARPAPQPGPRIYRPVGGCSPAFWPTRGVYVTCRRTGHLAREAAGASRPVSGLSTSVRKNGRPRSHRTRTLCRWRTGAMHDGGPRSGCFVAARGASGLGVDGPVGAHLPDGRADAAADLALPDGCPDRAGPSRRGCRMPACHDGVHAARASSAAGPTSARQPRLAAWPSEGGPARRRPVLEGSRVRRRLLPGGDRRRSRQRQRGRTAPRTRRPHRMAARHPAPGQHPGRQESGWRPCGPPIAADGPRDQAYHGAGRALALGGADQRARPPSRAGGSPATPRHRAFRPDGRCQRPTGWSTLVRADPAKPGVPAALLV
jgi:hypothetical protein